MIAKDIDPKGCSCGATSPRGLVIEPDGSIQKCYELVGDKTTIIGSILDENKNNNKLEPLCLKNLSEWHTWSPFNNADCIDCKVLPLCLGGCPYYSINEEIESKHKDRSSKCSSIKYNLDKVLAEMASDYID